MKQGVKAVMLDTLKKIRFINPEVFTGSRFFTKTNRKAQSFIKSKSIPSFPEMPLKYIIERT